MNQKIIQLNPSEEQDQVQISYFYQTKLLFVIFNELSLLKQTD